jgi:hypothetical protein
MYTYPQQGLPAPSSLAAAQKLQQASHDSIPQVTSSLPVEPRFELAL